MRFTSAFLFPFPSVESRSLAPKFRSLTRAARLGQHFFKPPPSLSRPARHSGGTPGLTVARQVRRLLCLIKALGSPTDEALIVFRPTLGRESLIPQPRHC
jgi:hypothetical protein